MFTIPHGLFCERHTGTAKILASFKGPIISIAYYEVFGKCIRAMTEMCASIPIAIGANTMPVPLIPVQNIKILKLSLLAGKHLMG
jgi:hypothetical protein